MKRAWPWLALILAATYFAVMGYIIGYKVGYRSGTDETRSGVFRVLDQDVPLDASGRWVCTLDFDRHSIIDITDCTRETP